LRETREKILFKALQYLVENDYETVSLNSIAEGIGITKGGIYHYFSSKEELFKECLVTVFEKMLSISLNAVYEEPKLEDMLRALFSFETYLSEFEIKIGINFAGNYFNFSYLMFMGMKKFPTIKNMVSEIYRQMQHDLNESFLSLQNQGIIRKDINCQYLAFELVAMAEGVMLISDFNKEIDMALVGNDFVKSTLARVLE